MGQQANNKGTDNNKSATFNNVYLDYTYYINILECVLELYVYLNYTYYVNILECVLELYVYLNYTYYINILEDAYGC